MQSTKYTAIELINNVCEKSFRSSARNHEKLMNCGIESLKKYQLINNYSIVFVARHGGIAKTFYKGNRQVKRETVLKQLGKEWFPNEQ